MKYTRNYREPHKLDDGTPIEFRAVQPWHKAMLAEGFTRLSPESRRRRFFTGKTGLSDEELRYLTEFDGTDHYALGAMLPASGPGGDDEPQGIGVARFVRSASAPETAEISIVVVDDWQHRGVGKGLLERIAGAAAERGIRRIRSVALADNPAVRELLERHTEGLEVRRSEPGVVEFSFPLTMPVSEDIFDALFSTLRLVALGSFIVPIWFGEQTVRRLLSLGRNRQRDADDTPNDS
ncbi:GNAT family N-acetyltransferase [Lentisalinibacter sediminis]|uniref:GNAT family N-acetyltransferase n=1 Tax=Lentisalinibacter sediminis TaxID=2992237 RepID=UPI0038675E5D